MTHQADERQRNPDDPLAGLEREALGDSLMAQRELIELEQHALRRWLFAQPATVPVTWTPGGPAEQTLAGDQRDPFNGVAVLNASPYPVAIGFEAGAGPASPFVVAAGAFLVLPVRYVNLSVALLAPLDTSQPTARAGVIRLRVAPLGVQAGQLGPALSAGPVKGFIGGAIGTVPTGAAGTSADLGVAPYTRLWLLAQLTTATAGDLGAQVFPWEVDGSAAIAVGLPSMLSAGPTIAAGIARLNRLYDVTGLDRVRVNITNAGAGSPAGGASYFLR